MTHPLSVCGAVEASGTMQDRIDIRVCDGSCKTMHNYSTYKSIHTKAHLCDKLSSTTDEVHVGMKLTELEFSEYARNISVVYEWKQ